MRNSSEDLRRVSASAATTPQVNDYFDKNRTIVVTTHQVEEMENVLTTLGRFLVAPGLWGGLIITAGFLFLAVRLRKYRGPV